jgi:hypothetical protein
MRLEMRGARLEGTGGGHVSIAIVAGAVLFFAAIGLSVYGGMAVPLQHDTVKVLPDARFAH